MTKSIAAAAILAAAAAAPVGAAVTFTTQSQTAGGIAVDPGYGSQTLIYDFDTTVPAAGALTGDFAIATAPGTPGISAAPSGTAAGTRYLTVPIASSNGQATLRLDRLYSAVSFYWGSIDDYQTLYVLGADGTSVIGTVPGASAATPTANGDQSGSGTNRRIFLTATGGDRIGGFTFQSNGYAFETDTYAGAAVPEPKTWAMLMLGFGLVGAAVRRRSRVSAWA